jgi:pyruvate-formate lyase-activating enzyme
MPGMQGCLLHCRWWFNPGFILSAGQVRTREFFEDLDEVRVR